MPHRPSPSSILTIGATLLLLSACATTRMHSAAELNSVGRECGLALGQLIQDESARRLLIVMEAAPSARQQSCIQRWAKKQRMNPVFIDSIEFLEN